MSFSKAAFSTLAVVVLAGCATPFNEAPIATNFPTTKQQKVQTAAHWNVIGQDVAQRLLAGMPTDRLGSLSVSASEKTPFNQALVNQVISTLVSQGKAVSKDDNSAFKVHLDTQIVAFNAPRSAYTMNGVPTLLAAGVWGVGSIMTAGSSVSASEMAHRSAAMALGLAGSADAYTWFRSEMASGDIPKTEIIVTASISDSTRYLARSTSAYYINEIDAALYQAPRQNQPAAVPAKTFRVKGD